MTRFGVMKHLKQLEDAGLVVTKRRGREKLHFLNPVPIRLVHDRWVSKYAEPWAAALSGRKNRLESPMEKVLAIYIKTTPERLWEAITEPEMRSKYNFGARVTSDWTPGSRYEMSARDGTVALGEGENLEVHPPRRLVQSFRALWERGREARGDLEGHLGDRAPRRFLPSDRHPRRASRGREQQALRRLVDDLSGLKGWKAVLLLGREKRGQVRPSDWPLPEISQNTVHRRERERGRRSDLDPYGPTTSRVVDQQGGRTTRGARSPVAWAAG